jgi:RNA polymerase sigma factor (sigma-70 family)
VVRRGRAGYTDPVRPTIEVTEPQESLLMPLVLAARDGRQSAFEQIFLRVIPEMQAFVRLHAGDHIRRRESDVDVVQSICREVLQDLGKFKGSGEGQFKKWLYTLALNKIQEKGRFHGAAKRAANREVSPVAPPAGESVAPTNDQILDCYKSFCTPSQHVAVAESVGNIEKVFDELSEDYRQVITLSCFLGLSHAEVAAEMGRNEGATRMLLSRARAELAIRLAQYDLG